MYSHCIFCHGQLGANEAIELFPVGRRLAFDTERGRLWVICARCGRWNLSPLEERWEAIEDCARIFRLSRLRVSTSNVGLARTRDGTELVRVGSPERSELAAWRYGAEFARRRKRMIGLATVGAALTVPLLLTGAYAAVAAAVPGGVLLIQVPHWVHIYWARRGVVARLVDKSETPVNIRNAHLGRVRLIPADSDDPRFRWKLQIAHDGGRSDVQGWDAVGISSKILARVNMSGAPANLIGRAVERIERSTEPYQLFRELAQNPADYFGTLDSLHRVDLLSLEMATHEESERRALQGELKALELAWKEAEEIAAIADSLPFVSTRIQLNDRNNE